MTNKIKFPCCVIIKALSFEEVKDIERVFLENNANKYVSVPVWYSGGYIHYGVDQLGDTMFYNKVSSYSEEGDRQSVKIYSYEEVMSFSKHKDNEWIKWNGGRCPLPDGTVVNLKIRNEDVFNNQRCEEWRWDKDGDCDDIVAYKVIEAPSTKPQQALNDSPCDDTHANESVSEENTEGFSNITVKHIQTVQISVKGYGVIEVTMNEAKHLLDELCTIFYS